MSSPEEYGPNQTAEGVLRSALEHEQAGSVKYLAIIDYAELAIVTLCYASHHPVEYREHGNRHLTELGDVSLDILNAIRVVTVEERIRQRLLGPDASLYYEAYTKLAPDICALFIGQHSFPHPAEPLPLSAYQNMLEETESLLWDQQDREAGRPVSGGYSPPTPLATDS